MGKIKTRDSPECHKAISFDPSSPLGTLMDVLGLLGMFGNVKGRLGMLRNGMGYLRVPKNTL